MRYFVPDLRLASQLPEQTKLEDKFGGLPWGLPVDQWPTCAECGQHQSLLAQLAHDDLRLNLGGPGRVLFVFQCNWDPGMCETWSGTSGANACFVLGPEQLKNGLVAAPVDGLDLNNEARASLWLEKDDGVDEKYRHHFFADHLPEPLPREIYCAPTPVTRLGSVPTFIQSPSEAPQDGWRFVGQLDGNYSFYSEVPSPEEVGCQVGHKTSEKWQYKAPKMVNPKAPPWVAAASSAKSEIRWFCEAANFGDAGLGYIFLYDAEPYPEGYFFWQCS